MDDLKLTSVDKVKATAPDLIGDMDDDTLNRLIEDASITVIADGFPKEVVIDDNKLDIREIASRYLALHIATMDSKSGQGISSEKVDVIERHYFDKTSKDWLNSSTWGQTYLRWYHLYGNGHTTHFMVVQHL